MPDSFPPRRRSPYPPATSQLLFPRPDGTPEDFSPYWPHGLDFSSKADVARRDVQPSARVNNSGQQTAPTAQVSQPPGPATAPIWDTRTGPNGNFEVNHAFVGGRPLPASMERSVRVSQLPIQQTAPAATGLSERKAHQAAPPSIDYGAFPTFYTEWSKRYPDAPKFVPARQWNDIAPDPTNMEKEAKYGPYTTITFHHTGSEQTPQSVAEFDRGRENTFHPIGRQIAHLGHAERHNDADVTYHFLIDKDGSIFEGRSLVYEGAHVWGRNPKNIGVAFLGDYTSNRLSDAQVKSAKALIHALNDAYHVADHAKGGAYIFTHKDIASSTPGHERPLELVGAQAQMDEIKFWSRSTLPHRSRIRGRQ